MSIHIYNYIVNDIHQIPSLQSVSYGTQTHALTHSQNKLPSTNLVHKLIQIDYLDAKVIEHFIDLGRCDFEFTGKQTKTWLADFGPEIDIDLPFYNCHTSKH